jgi:uncharacterized membrane protein YhfC
VLKFGVARLIGLNDARFLAWFGPRVGRPLHWLYVGLLTGVFECGATWLLAWRTRVRRADWNQAVAFGVGFGAVEAILVGLFTLVGLAVAMLFWAKVPPDRQATILQGTSTRLAFVLPAFERAVALAGHAASCVLIVWSVQRREARWFWIAFWFKTFVDGFAAWGITSFGVKSSPARLVEFELMLAVVVAILVGCVILLRTRLRPQAS